MQSEPDDADPLAQLPWGCTAQSTSHLSSSQTAAIWSYTLTLDSSGLNQALRKPAMMTNRRRRQAELIRSALRPATYEFRVTRAVQPDHLGLTSLRELSLLIGTAKADRGFLSTSAKAMPPVSHLRGDAVILELAVDIGVPVLGVREISEFALDEEIIVIDNATVYFFAYRPDAIPRLFGVVYAEEAWR